MSHIVFTLSKLGGGGAERVVSVWASKLAAEERKVSIILMHRQDDEYPLDPRVNIIPLGETKEQYLALSYLERLVKLRQTIKKLSPTTLINFLPRMQVMVYIATWGMHLYRIETVRDNPWKTYESPNWESNIWNRCFKKANHIIVQTNGQKDFFSKKIVEKTVLIPNPIHHVYAQTFEKEYKEKACRFIAAGRLHPQKNYPMMIRAFADACYSNSDIYLDIWGSGDAEYTAKLENLIIALGVQDRIRLCGRTETLINEYRPSDAFILASDHEGMPNALAEAMASQLVCIATDCPTGPSDLISDGENGYLIPVGDTAALTAKIELVSHMSANERKAMAQKARQYALAFCSDKNSIEQLKKILR